MKCQFYGWKINKYINYLSGCIKRFGNVFISQDEPYPGVVDC